MFCSTLGRCFGGPPATAFWHEEFAVAGGLVQKSARLQVGLRGPLCTGLAWIRRHNLIEVVFDFTWSLYMFLPPFDPFSRAGLLSSTCLPKKSWLFAEKRPQHQRNRHGDFRRHEDCSASNQRQGDCAGSSTRDDDTRRLGDHWYRSKWVGYRSMKRYDIQQELKFSGISWNFSFPGRWQVGLSS